MTPKTSMIKSRPSGPQNADSRSHGRKPRNIIYETSQHAKNPDTSFEPSWMTNECQFCGDTVRQKGSTDQVYISAVLNRAEIPNINPKPPPQKKTDRKRIWIRGDQGNDASPKVLSNKIFQTNSQLPIRKERTKIPEIHQHPNLAIVKFSRDRETKI